MYEAAVIVTFRQSLSKSNSQVGYKVKSDSGPDLTVSMSLWKIPVSFYQVLLQTSQSQHI